MRLILKSLKHRLNSLLRDKEYHAKLNEKEKIFSCLGLMGICI